MWAQHCWICVWIPWHFKQFKLQELCISVRGIKKEAAFCSVMMFYWISKVAWPSRESLGCQENSIFASQPSALLRQHLQNYREYILSTLRRNSVRLNPFFPWTKEGDTFYKASLNQQRDLKHLARSWLQEVVLSLAPWRPEPATGHGHPSSANGQRLWWALSSFRWLHFRLWLAELSN